MNGKTEKKTQSGQQKKTRPLENKAQNKLTTDRFLSVVELMRK